jgi:2-dehydro-3-deoxyphosphooctonate aldolase (KDO 8-P synthase)
MLEIYNKPVAFSPEVSSSSEKPILFAGPCAAESYDLCAEVAGKVKELAQELGFTYVFKASYDKANRTSGSSFRGLGMDTGLEILSRIGKEFSVPVITDVHESEQVPEVAEVVDVLQIPAFLCRQTDLLLAAGASGKAVNIKKGQFMAPADMQYAVDKIRGEGNENVLLTERGTSFGYHNLVVDMRSLPTMRQYAPVIFDVTHSVQQPGGMGGSSGGQRQFAGYLARAAAAAGVDGFFIETHPMPEKALSDGPNMVPLHQLEHFLADILAHWKLSNKQLKA